MDDLKLSPVDHERLQLMIQALQECKASHAGNDVSVFFFGTGGFGGITLQNFMERGAHIVGVCTRPDPGLLSNIEHRSKRVAKRLLRIPDFEQIVQDHFEDVVTPYRRAKRLGIPVYDLDQIYTRTLRDFTNLARPDFIVSAGFPNLIPGDVLSSARIAALNFHPGILPIRAGATPCRTSILEGDLDSALTIHHMTEHFDSGPSVIVHAVSIEPRETFGTLERKIASRIPQAVAEILTDPDAFRPVNGTGEPSRTKLCPKVSRLAIDLQSEDPETISRKIRALQPRAAIPIEMDGRRVAIWEHDVTPDGLQIKSVFDGVRIRPYL